MFDADAWLCVQQIVGVKMDNERRSKLSYYCGICTEELISSSVQCESCLQWCHQRCVPKYKEKKAWYCPICVRK